MSQVKQLCVNFGLYVPLPHFHQAPQHKEIQVVLTNIH